MKKTIVGIMTIVAMIVAILGTNVNAATMSANPSEVKAGEDVTVTVKTNENVQLAQYELVYNPEYVEPVVDNAGNVEITTTGLETKGASKVGDNKVRVSAFGTAGDTVSIKFKALKDTDAANFSVENASFSVDGRTPNGETVTNTASVKIGENAEDPTPTPTEVPEDPTPTPTAQPTEAPKTTEKPSNGLKYPQTGAPVYAYVAGIALVAIVAGAVVAVRKNK